MEDPLPFQQYLGTNYIPTSQEIDTLKTLIVERRGVIDAIDAEISELTRKRIIHVQYFYDHWALASPTRRLPDDILLNIFFEALPLAEPWPSAHPAVVVSCVCHRWRELALSVPLLWTRIEFMLPWASTEKEHRNSLFHETLRRDNMEAYLLRCIPLFRPYVDVVVERVRAFVERSRGCPLDLCISADDIAQAPSSSQLCNEWEVLLETLFALIPGPGTRWKNLNLNLKVSLAYPVSLRLLQMLSASSGSEMRSATLSIQTHSPHTPIPGAQWNDLLPAGRFDLHLAELRAFSVRMRYADMSRIETSWDGLTTLMIGAPTSAPPFLPEEALIILRQTPNLIECTIVLSFPLSHQTPDLNPLTLANVKSFTIKGYTPPRAFAEAPYPFVCCRCHRPHRDVESAVVTEPPSGLSFQHPLAESLIRPMGTGTC